MKTPLRSWLLLSAAIASMSLLGACAGSQTVRHSSGTPVNPETDPGGQGVPGARSTGANSQQGANR